MDKRLFKAVCEKVPKINPDIANGIACLHMKGSEQYLSNAWKGTVEKQFPSCITYEGCRRLTPEEEYASMVRCYKNTNIIELATTNYFTVRYTLGHRDKTSNVFKTIDADMRVPYVTKGGKIHIRGTVKWISPVLADNVFSVSGNRLFMQAQVKHNLYRISYYFNAGDEKKVVSLPWGILHLKAINAKETKKVVRPTLVHYLFSWYGVEETFKTIDVNVRVIVEDDVEKFKDDEWLICRSSGIMPSYYRGKYDYRVPKVVIAIERKTIPEDDKLLMQLVGGFFYIADHFGYRLSKYASDKRQWQLLLGFILFGEDIESEGVLISKIDVHLKSISGYVDAVTEQGLADDGIYVKDIFELFMYIIKHIQGKFWSTDPLTSYGKKIQVLPYVLSHHVDSINMLSFKIDKTNDEISYDDFAKLVKRYIKPDCLFSELKDHNEINIISTPSDCLLFEQTKMVPQTSTGNGGYKGHASDPKLLHASIAEVGTYFNQHGPESSGIGFINPYLELGEKGEVMRSKKYRPMMDHIQRKFKVR